MKDGRQKGSRKRAFLRGDGGERCQLLPAYNVQIGVADEFIAVIDVSQYRSDMDLLRTPDGGIFTESMGNIPKVSCGRCRIWIFQQLHLLRAAPVWKSI